MRFPSPKSPSPSAVLLLAAIGLIPASTERHAATASQADVSGGTSPLWVSMSPMGEERHLMVVVDPAARSAAVYHLAAESGSLTLKSSRDLRWDLMVGEFNATEPTPAALRKMLESAPPAPRP